MIVLVGFVLSGEKNELFLWFVVLAAVTYQTTCVVSFVKNRIKQNNTKTSKNPKLSKA